MIQQQPLLTGVKPLQTRQERPCCAKCGQRMPVASPHLLNEVLVSGIWKLLKAGGGPRRLNELGLTTSEHGNSNQWQHFGLAVRDRGKWLLTVTGRKFLKGETTLPRKVWTTRKDGKIVVVDRDGAVGIKDVSKEVWERMDYAREARIA